MQKVHIKAGDEYAFREARSPDALLQRIRILQQVRGQKWKAEWIEPNPGLVDYVESRNLFVRWPDLAPPKHRDGCRLRSPGMTDANRVNQAGLTLRVDPWAPEYDASLQLVEEDESEAAPVDITVERPAWGAVAPTPGSTPPLSIVDGGRRVELAAAIDPSDDRGSKMVPTQRARGGAGAGVHHGERSVCSRNSSSCVSVRSSWSRLLISGSTVRVRDGPPIKRARLRAAQKCPLCV